jgi:hypothetical protein
MLILTAVRLMKERKCMGLRGYALVPKDQAEDARAGFAASQRVSRPSAAAGGK